MRFIGIGFGVVILLGWLIGAASLPFTRRRGPLWSRLLTIPAAILMAVGAIGFFGQGIAASGGLNWLPGSFEWPVGRGDGVITLPNGDHVVPLPCNRIQVYDANWRFLRGWMVDASAGDFRLIPLGQDRIETPSQHYPVSPGGGGSRDGSRVVWCGVAVAWNLGIFAALLKEAQQGHGWFVLLLVIWSLAGWFLLFVLFVGIGCSINGLLRAARRTR